MTDGNIVGNVYDKYGTSNPIARWLMNGFLDAVTELYDQAAASSVLEVGCGEGMLAHRLIQSGSTRPQRFMACDLSLDEVIDGLDPDIEFRVATIYELPFADNSFDLVICCEVLEHLEEPARGLAELARVARSHVLLSTPREPIWRVMNLARGKYISALGNTPGHIQHFSRADLLRLASAHLTLIQQRLPLPWSVVLGTPNANPSL